MSLVCNILHIILFCIFKKSNVVKMQVELFGLKDSAFIFGENALILLGLVRKINSPDFVKSKSR